MKIERTWAMPNKWTFTIKPIRELLEEEMDGSWADPFAGMHSPADMTNDLNPLMNAIHHKDALDFLKELQNASYDGVLFDPPYSPRQLKECYGEIGQSLHDTKSSVWSNWKDEVSRVVRPGGKVISFGWNSMGMGLNRGFTIERILIVPHGGMHNDTIVTVEVKNE